MYEEEIIFGKLLLKQFEMVFEHWTLVPLTFDPKINRVLCCQTWMCGQSLRKVIVLELLIGNGLGTLDL